jgi:hypothetical protein
MNRLITAEQIINDALSLMDKHDLPRLFAEDSPEERREMLHALSNMFGGRFPLDGDTK